MRISRLLRKKEGLDLNPARASSHMRRLFAGDLALNAGLEEKSFMAERKSGSDLDVFEGLGRKSAPAPDEAPTPFAPRVASNTAAPGPLARHKTLLGMPATNLPPPGFPVTPGKSLPPPPPRASVPPPMPGASRPSTGFPSAPSPRGGSAPSGPPMFRPGATTPPPMPKAAAAPRPGSGAEVDMDWDEEDEKTTVFEKEAQTGVSSPGQAGPKVSASPPPLGAPPKAVRTLTGTGSWVRPPAPGGLPNPFVPRSSSSFAPPPGFPPHSPPL